MRGYLVRKFLILFLCGLLAYSIPAQFAFAFFSKPPCKDKTILEEASTIVVGSQRAFMIQVTSRWHGNDQEHFLYSPSNSFDEIMAEAIKRVVEKPAISLSHPINVITKHDFSDLSDLRKTVVIGYDYDVSNVDENNDIARLSVYISGPYSGEVLNFPSRFSEDIEIPIPFEAKPSRETVTDLLENHFRKHFFDICGEKL